ncbi:MAG: hypothetical protein RLP02_02720 [Coleofasciculus sp. C2-GNP5-27]
MVEANTLEFLRMVVSSGSLRQQAATVLGTISFGSTTPPKLLLLTLVTLL